MPSLRDYDWQVKYSPDLANLLPDFYIPALSSAVRYWRTTGYFQAAALALALRGIEGLIRNQGTMRLIVGCTLGEAEIAAIAAGETLQTVISNNLLAQPLVPPDQAAADALELLAWMVQHHILDVKVAIPCDDQRQPRPMPELFHEKAGILEDKEGDRLAFNGSINETPNGWLRNWESFHVFTSWQTPDHVDAEETSFYQLWNDRSAHALVLSIPNAVHAHLLSHAPLTGQLPRRLQHDPPFNPTPSSSPATLDPLQPQPSPDSGTPVPRPIDPYRIIWSYLQNAPATSPAGDWVGAATSAVTPWPHQIHAFHRLWHNWPPKLLLADEVGLGKTIQAGLILRQAWLSGRAKRILVLAPASVLKQWQLELREKFNLHWPLYDGKALNWCPSPSRPAGDSRPVPRTAWHQEPYVIASSHLMRRSDRRPELLEQAEPWDLIILDEAHHARRQGGAAQSSRPNQLLALMQRLKTKTQGLVLLTATPMQVDPIEVWDLLKLLGLPKAWTAEDFLRFFERANLPNPSHGDLAYLARLFRAVEVQFGPINPELARKLSPGQRKLAASKILKALRSPAQTPLRQLDHDHRQAALKIIKAHSPIQALISRHTRSLLRRYHQQGHLSIEIATRQVKDTFIDLSPAERQVYEAVEDYISSTYNNAAAGERNAIGFVMTIYRKRLASSFAALAQTLQNRLDQLHAQSTQTALNLQVNSEDLPDDEELAASPDPIDLDEALSLEHQALQLEETSDLEKLLNQVQALDTDTKTLNLLEKLQKLQKQGYKQVIIFTQFTDTLDFLRSHLSGHSTFSVMCFSGRGGEIYSNNSWKTISREETKQKFAQGLAEIMLCTDAAAEGLNFQFCGALINYDMPWNPMRVEQRIGRIDRLGQRYSTIQIYNLHYKDTIETDVYTALKDRINLFETVVGRLQPILSTLSSTIARLALSTAQERTILREQFLSQLETKASHLADTDFDLDDMLTETLMKTTPPDPAFNLQHLHLILSQPSLLPPGTTTQPAGPKDFSYNAPGLPSTIRVTTDARFYDQHSDSVELWSPGNPLFPQERVEPLPIDPELFMNALNGEI